ncbi:hypothetical protein ACS89_13910 [Vibrio parahaemolyticus]|nr:hypothetical protein ACS90_17250 [Vibrio parahaemolyticus]KOE15308.1 hypothetical protein ACS89_13910 [Vibrio parahaemolyticus]KOF13766.1 hypothetical protein ACX16_22790 [Vibrio parahaemolyticus]OQU50738.1 hypothetical protein EM74_008595 [Vibrio parahaemolyticus]
MFLITDKSPKASVRTSLGFLVSTYKNQTKAYRFYLVWIYAKTVITAFVIAQPLYSKTAPQNFFL